MLEVPHLHITLTTDDSFRPFFRKDSRLLKELLRVGTQAGPEVLFDLYPGMQIGLVYTVHTFDRDLGYKPHVHLVITKGGLVDGKWVEIEGIPANRLSAKWRYLLCKRLREVCPSDTTLQQVIAKTYTDHHGFMVHTESFYPKGIEAARYIGRYLGHPPLATSHLTDYDGKTVTFWYKDTQTGEKIVVRCSALDFISFMVPHIPPKGLQMVRYAGFYARCVKRRWLEIVSARSGSAAHTISSVRSRSPFKVRRTSEMARAHPSQFRLRSSCLPALRPHNGTCRNMGAKTRFRLDETLAGDPSYAQGRPRCPERSVSGQTIQPPSKIASQVSPASARLRSNCAFQLEHILNI
jgi:hypothetical protein